MKIKNTRLETIFPSPYLIQVIQWKYKYFLEMLNKISINRLISLYGTFWFNILIGFDFLWTLTNQKCLYLKSTVSLLSYWQYNHYYPLDELLWLDQRLMNYIYSNYLISRNIFNNYTFVMKTTWFQWSINSFWLCDDTSYHSNTTFWLRKMQLILKLSLSGLFFISSFTLRKFF